MAVVVNATSNFDNDEVKGTNDDDKDIVEEEEEASWWYLLLSSLVSRGIELDAAITCLAMGDDVLELSPTI